VVEVGVWYTGSAWLAWNASKTIEVRIILDGLTDAPCRFRKGTYVRTTAWYGFLVNDRRFPTHTIRPRGTSEVFRVQTLKFTFRRYCTQICFSLTTSIRV